MTATTETRKRSREDDGCDSMPLSKRINNLHINNSLQDYAAHESLGHSSNSHHIRPGGENSSAPQLDGTAQGSSHAAYNPELDHLENPYYYSKNKLLYELHLERIQRTQHP